MKELHMLTFTLMVVGALNWGLVGLFGFNVVEQIFGAGTSLTNIVYILVGLSGLWELMKYGKKM